MEKMKLAVIFGGVSSEHEVSRMSVTSILTHLSKEKYEIYILGITKTGRWLLYSGDIDQILDGAWEQDSANVPAILSPDAETHGMIILREGRAETVRLDAVFPVLHGKNGEDGTIQGLMQLSAIPFVGCDTLSSAVCMDKAVSHTLLAAANIEQAHYLWFYADRFDKAADVIKNKIEARLEFPIFVKPANAGSSVGVSRVENKDGLDAAVQKAAKEDKKILVENGVTGKEVECAVMGNGDPVASIVGEINAGAEFYDYDDKYINGVSEQIIPAGISDEAAKTLRETAVRAYRLLGCTGLARVDFFVTPDDRVVLNEINTLPGFTAISMYPKLFMEMGMPYGEILDRLIEHAMERR